MSDEKELAGGSLPGDDGHAADERSAAPQGSDSSIPRDDSDPRYDVAGAALGALAPAEETELYAAAAVDPNVSAELAAMEAVVAELARLAPVTAMNRGRSAGIRSRLVARAAATHAGRPLAKSAAPEAPQQAMGTASRANTRPVSSATPSSRRGPNSPRAPGATSGGGSGGGSSPSASARHVTGSHAIPFEPRSRPGIGRMVGTIALAAAILIAAFGIYNWRSQSRSGSTVAAAGGVQDSSLAEQIAELRASVAQKDSLIAALTGMHTRVIDLVAYNSAEPMGRVFWDQKKQMFMMYASNLKRPPSGKIYQVWLMARGTAPVSAGTFMPDSTGSAIMTASQPMQPGALRRIAVTEEADGGVAAPTGPVVFAGVGR